MSEYPKWMYHETEKPRSVKNSDQEEALYKEGWSTEYIPQSYPKYVAGKEGEPGRVVSSPEEERGEPAPPPKKKG